jgi:hypothetical protein
MQRSPMLILAFPLALLGLCLCNKRLGVLLKTRQFKMFFALDLSSKPTSKPAEVP